MRILGIDPGSQVTGYGLIEGTARGPLALHFGTLRPPRNADLPDRLLFLFRGLRVLIEEHEPDLVAVETAFYHKHARSALVLGQVRGVIVLGARDCGAPVHEVSPREVKMGVTGHGGASKEQVQYMIKNLLRLPETPPVDASDALAIAVCAFQRQKTRPATSP